MTHTEDIPNETTERHVRFYLERDQPTLFLYDDKHHEGIPIAETHPVLIAWALHVVKAAEAGEYPPEETATAHHIAARVADQNRRLDEAARIRQRLRIIAADKGDK